MLPSPAKHKMDRRRSRRQQFLILLLGLLILVLGHCDLESEEALDDVSFTKRKYEQNDPKLVDYVRNHVLVPPSTEPYNLGLPEYAPENPSQYKQNEVALEVLRKVNKDKNGFFIEAGTLDGVYLSNSLLLERKLNWTGLLIEVHPNYYESLKSKNRKAWIAHAGLSITPYSETMSLHISPIGWHSLVKQEEWHKSGETIQVRCIPLFTFLLALGIDTVDYFSLDVERAEWGIIQTIPFDKVKFLVFEVETDNYMETKPLIRAHLEKNGYLLYREISPDSIFVHESLKDFL